MHRDFRHRSNLLAASQRLGIETLPSAFTDAGFQSISAAPEESIGMTI
jgi:hypothetical protein